MYKKESWGLRAGLSILFSALAVGCGPEDQSNSSASSGQVKAVALNSMSSYAAARFAEQATFGVTPEVVNAMAAQGPGAWVDAQMALPVEKMLAPSNVIDFKPQDPIQEPRAYAWAKGEFLKSTLNSSDQLRRRVAWALFQYIPVNDKVRPYGVVEYYNVLLGNAFGNYRDLLRDVTLSPAMGEFLDNNQNRAVSAECIDCAPNENFARELLQLFSLGVVQLNPEGSMVRDVNGRPKETYSQKDVEELARALTGWQNAPGGGTGTNSSRYEKQMVPAEWRAAHDRNAKVVLGTNFPAGREAPQELETILDMLMAHPNIAPFVALRMIQHLVTSDPTPQYVGRVAAAFRNNGQGVVGDMKAVIRAVLLDPEARSGDIPGASPPRFGKLREPVLWWSATLRGLGCKVPLKWPNGVDGSNWVIQNTQFVLNPISVFSYYLPTDRAPGSNLLAPEQKLLGADEMTFRLGTLRWLFSNENAAVNAAAGCQVGALAQAFALSPKAFADEVSKRWFRGAMPPTLRNNLLSLSTSQSWGSSQEAALTLMSYALTTPYFGAIK